MAPANPVLLISGLGGPGVGWLFQDPPRRTAFFIEEVSRFYRAILAFSPGGKK